MKTHQFCHKWITFVGFLVLTILPINAAREAAVSNTSPTTGTSKIVVRNLTTYSIDVFIGDQVAHSMGHLTKRVFSRTEPYKPPYQIEVVFGPGFLESKRIRFNNPDSKAPYETPTQTFNIPLGGGSFTPTAGMAVRNFFAEYQWIDGYWEITLKVTLK